MSVTTQSGRNGGRILVDALRIHGADRIFCVPGESYLDVLDALYDTPQIELIVAKHEGAAANMAEADGKLTGRPGICFVTRGPGATHASIGVHTARQDSTPMILFIGQVDRRNRAREGFQEVEFHEMFAPLAKWAAEVPDASRIPEYIARAFQTATSGRPGPVVLSLPEDTLAQVVEVSNTQAFRTIDSMPAAGDMDTVRAELARSVRPMVIVGGSGWTDAAAAEVTRFVELNDLPVAASFRRQDIYDNDREQYIGHMTLGMAAPLAEGVRNADLLISIGSRMSEVTSGGYKLIESPCPRQRLIHIHPDPEELGRVFQPTLGIPVTVGAFARALSRLEPIEQRPWSAWREKLRAAYVAFRQSPPVEAEHSGVHMASVVTQLADELPADAIVANGAGNYTVWVHRFYRYRRPRTELAPTSGAMGYGVPAAIAAKLRYPERTVVCFAGDGCFLMYPQELATAMQYGVAIVILVVNNGMYGTIRMHQERRFPGRVVGTDLQTPDFLALAKSFGAYAERIQRTEDFADAFARASQSGRPAVIELQVDPAQITPNARLAQTEPATVAAHVRAV